MNKINVPAISCSFYELKVYNIKFASDLDSFVSIVAPDALIAVQAFTFLHPEKDVMSVSCCGPCVALYPTFPSHE